MDRRNGKFWIINAFGTAFAFLAVWVLAVVWIGFSGGIETSFAAGLRSRLIADYGQDSFPLRLRAMGLSIFADIFSDQGSAGDGSNPLAAAMSNPVPTATLEDGEAPLKTATPTINFTATSEAATLTAIWAVTPTATPTLTHTPTPTPTNTPTATPTPTPTHTKQPTATTKPSSTTSCGKELCPVLICVEYTGSGSYSSVSGDDYIAYYDYESEATEDLDVAVGSNNYFYPDPKDRGQPTHFVAGHQPNESNPAFGVSFNGESMKWKLMGIAAWADANSPSCSGTIEPTETPTLEATSEETLPTATPEPTSTPADTSAPSLSGGTMSPTPGALDVCEVNIKVEDLRVIDPAPSSGITEVRLKYNVVDYSGWIFSDPMQLYSGGYTDDGGWDGRYYGSIWVEIDPTWPAPDIGYFKVELHARALDAAGHAGYTSLGTYTMPASCGSQ